MEPQCLLKLPNSPLYKHRDKNILSPLSDSIVKIENGILENSTVNKGHSDALSKLIDFKSHHQEALKLKSNMKIAESVVLKEIQEQNSTKSKSREKSENQKSFENGMTEFSYFHKWDTDNLKLKLSIENEMKELQEKKDLEFFRKWNSNLKQKWDQRKSVNKIKELISDKELVVKKELIPEKELIPNKELIANKELILEKKCSENEHNNIESENDKVTTQEENVTAQEENITTEIKETKLLKPENQKTQLNENKEIEHCRSCVIIADPTINLCRQYITSDRLLQLRKIVERAIREHKTFTIKGGYATVRRALVSRGWVEKWEHKSTKITSAGQTQTTSINLSTDDIYNDLPKQLAGESVPAHIDKCEKTIMSRMLQIHSVDFYWNLKRDSNEWHHRIQKGIILNRYAKSPFTSKEGLCAILQHTYWHNEPGIACTLFPRSYNTAFPDQLSMFIDDYRLTACMSLLKWLTETLQKEGELGVSSCEGKVPYSAVQFAINRCQEFISSKKHEDIDKEDTHIWDHEWEVFITHYLLLVHENCRLISQADMPVRCLEVTARSIMVEMVKYWPQISLDGLRNIWIVKPGNKCRGRGIQLTHKSTDVLNIATITQNRKARFVVQKYIEKPLLIHDTKFDIRQWFLVTSTQPLTIWMYKDSYLRFSSQKFNLENYHESVHLTNNAVQCKYKNAKRNTALPDENMWDCYTFKAYLKQIEHSQSWDNTIYPGMRESIVGAMLASQDYMDRRLNSFELYGADFMLTEDFKPWLLEINSCPDMAPTTSITARMCPQCLEDVIKVIIDRRHDSNADTGRFELVYRQVLPRTPPYLGLNLSIRGRRIHKARRIQKYKMNNKLPSPPVVTAPKPPKETPITVPVKSSYSGPVIEDLMDEIKITVHHLKEDNFPTTKFKSQRKPMPIEMQPFTKKLIGDKKLISGNIFRKQLSDLDRKSDVIKPKNPMNNAGYYDEFKQKNPMNNAVNSNKIDINQSISLFNEWKKNVEKMHNVQSRPNSSNERWDRNTASILQINNNLPETKLKTKITENNNNVVKTCDKQDNICTMSTLELKQENNIANANTKITPRKNAFVSTFGRLFPRENKTMPSADELCKSLLAVGLRLKTYDNTKAKLLLPNGVQNTYVNSAVNKC